MKRMRKNGMKTILKQKSNSRQRKDIVPNSNPKARKKRLLLSLPIHLAHHPIAAAAVAPLSLRCYSVVAPLSHRYRYAVAPLSLRCHTAIAPLLHHYRSTAALLLSLLLSLRNCSCYSLNCRYAVAPLLLRCRSAVAPV